MKPGRYGAIDIGTVTCRLLVADVDAAGLHERAKGYAITNLGEGVDATGELKTSAMDRVCQAVSDFQKQMDDLGADIPVHLTAMATSASRDAKNAAEFQKRLADQGVALSVIPGQREAALTFRGACCGLEGQPVMVVDIGGGSTEVVAGIAGADPQMGHSFDIGCRRVTERFFHGDLVTSDQIERARDWIVQQMSPYFQEMCQRGLLPARMVAVAGTATSVVSIHLEMERYDSSVVHGYEVTRDVLEEVYARLTGMTTAQRRQVIGLDPGRAPVIVAGLVILRTIVDLAALEGFTVSESDILHGIILDAAERSW